MRIYPIKAAVVPVNVIAACILWWYIFRANMPNGPCSQNPCRNGATCREYNEKDYMCTCRPDFTGKHCESEFDEIHIKRESLWKSSITKAANQNKTQRYPDVIGIGVEKCGTDALITFLRFHPLVKYPNGEPHFFDSWYHKGINYYLSLFPKVSDDEILIEKTPAYFNYLPTDIPFKIKKWVPNAKIVLILCDPVNRAYSDFVHEKVMKAIPDGLQFDSFVDKYLSEEKGNLRKILHMTDSEAYNYIMKLHRENYPSHIFTTGLYYYHLLRWNEAFGLDNLYIISGENMISQPGVEIAKLQNYLGLPYLLLEEDFVRNNKTGFYCLAPKWSKDVKISIGELRHRICLSKEKGRTRNKRKKASNTTMDLLKGFYKPFNEKLFHLLNKDMGWQ